MPRRRWVPRLADDEAEALYASLARALREDIERGRLSAGQRLPGSRTLAESLGIHRNTVLAALEALEVEGWVRTEPARGTFVAEGAVPERPRASRGLAPRADVPRRAGYPMPSSRCDAPEGHALDDLLILAGGMPDSRTFPAAQLARAYRSEMRRHGDKLLEYGEARGLIRLREALSQMLADERGLATRPEDVLLTRGSQQALFLAAQTLLRPGDRVAVEEYGYPPAWEALRYAGAQLVPVEVDARGMCVERLARLHAQSPLRAVYLTPHHQFPTLATLSAGRRRQLLQLARSHGWAVIEDDYDHEFHYHGRPVLPLASADREGVVVYVGTLSKVLAPGLRLGYVVAPPEVLSPMARLRTIMDRQGDLPTEAALAAFIEDGELARHARRNRRIYESRRQALVDALRRQLGEALRFDVPSGGMALWLEAEPRIDVARWQKRCVDRGVLFTPGRALHFRGDSPHTLRLGFARADEGELRWAVQQMARALKAAR